MAASNSTTSRPAAAPGVTPRWITEALLHRDLWFAMAIMAVIAVLVIPMPAWLLDVGLAISITQSTLILLVAILTRRALDFSSFPTILLVATMIRLTLNLSSTRLILRAGAALMLAGRNRELTMLGDNFGGEMKDTALADLFKQLTAPGADYSLLIAPDMAKALTVTQ